MTDVKYWSLRNTQCRESMSCANLGFQVGVPKSPGAGRRQFDTNHSIWWGKIRNLRPLPTPVRWQRKPADGKRSCQTALSIPRTVPANPWKEEKSDVTPNYEAVGGFLFLASSTTRLLEPQKSTWFTSPDPLQCARGIFSQSPTRQLLQIEEMRTQGLGRSHQRWSLFMQIGTLRAT